MAVAVRRAGDGWTVVAEGRSRGRFAFRVDAEEAALRLVEEARRAGREAEAHVQGPGGKLTPLRGA